MGLFFQEKITLSGEFVAKSFKITKLVLQVYIILNICLFSCTGLLNTLQSEDQKVM